MKSTFDEKLVLFCPRRLTENHKLLYHQELNRATINRVRHMQAVAADRLLDEGYMSLFFLFTASHPMMTGKRYE
jgi:hypothetical protein